MQTTGVRPPAAAELLGITRNTLWRWARERSDFPRPRRLSPKVTIWDRAELIEWRDSQTVHRKAV